ncbi:hypothetical protein, partial [Shewanella hafniensis]|uniref:hypothetical protein n=1 Tax=Shewanella hafniensis TaxID=365590 RepID=UPI001C7F4820
YRKKANSYSIIHTHLHGCGSGQVQQAIYALQTAQRINTKTLGGQIRIGDLTWKENFQMS